VQGRGGGCARRGGVQGGEVCKEGRCARGREQVQGGGSKCKGGASARGWGARGVRGGCEGGCEWGGGSARGESVSG
jgi:hypothetical protein